MIAFVLFNNFTVSTLGQNFTQVVFAFKVTPQLMTTGLIIALVRLKDTVALDEASEMRS